MYPYFRILFTELSAIFSMDSKLFMTGFNFLTGYQFLTILKNCSCVFFSSQSNCQANLGSIPSFSPQIGTKIQLFYCSSFISTISDTIFYFFALQLLIVQFSTKLSASKITTYRSHSILYVIQSSLISFIELIKFKLTFINNTKYQNNNHFQHQNCSQLAIVLIQKEGIFLITISDIVFKFSHILSYFDLLYSKKKIMLNKLKNTVSNMMEAEKLAQHQVKKIDVPVLSGEEIKIYRKILQRFKENVQTLDQIGQNNKQDLILFIKNRQKQAAQNKANPQSTQESDRDEDDKNFTFADDMKEIKDTLHELQVQTKQILAFEQQIINKINHIQDPHLHPQTQTPPNPNIKITQDLLAKYELQIAALKKSQDNNKEILNTLGQQSQLYVKEMRELQEKSQKLEKQLNEKNTLINNLKEEKNVLLEMRNSSTTGQLPEVEALKYKLTQFQKRLNLQRSKVEAKEKEIESLKKKMEEQHQSLEKIADQLKEKQLKSKKIIDKYERSKTQIRKFREEKTEFIKQLNMEVAKMSQELAQEKKKSQSLTQQVAKLKQEVQNLKSEVSKNENRKIQLQSSQAELVEVRSQLHEKNMFAQDQALQIKKLRELNDQLQNKRKQLLEALQKPINHQIRTLQKILKALDKLYKDYITTVFQDGNIVGFQAKITYIISNIQEIKQDLLL